MRMALSIFNLMFIAFNILFNQSIISREWLSHRAGTAPAPTHHTTQKMIFIHDARGLSVAGI
jgi:hypothetical protein